MNWRKYAEAIGAELSELTVRIMDFHDENLSDPHNPIGERLRAIIDTGTDKCTECHRPVYSVDEHGLCRHCRNRRKPERGHLRLL